MVEVIKRPKSGGLLDNLNSDLIEAFSALQPKKHPRRVLVYVESDDDIAFWKSILVDFESDDILFDIQLPIRNKLEKGKASALNFTREMGETQTGRHLIACVDSDYDYLLQGMTRMSRTVNDNPYVFQTYSYSIENLMCFSGSLQPLCVLATKNDRRVVDFDELARIYSGIIYEVLLWSVYLVRMRDSHSFPLTEFGHIIRIDYPNLKDKFQGAFKALRLRVDKKVRQLRAKFPNSVQSVDELKKELVTLGVTPQNCYLFAHGHTIRDDVFRRFLQSVFDDLVNEKTQQIKYFSKHKMERDNQLNHYAKQVMHIDDALNCNMNFKKCFLYQKIKSDLEHYMGDLKKNIVQKYERQEVNS